MTPYLVWKEEYSVGVHSLDEQHRILFDLINTLHEATQNDHNEESLRIVLHRLTEYADAHFGEEEKFMLESGFPEYEAHRLEHNELVRRLSDFSEDLRENPREVSMGLLEFLSNWIHDHLLKTDARYLKEQDSPPGEDH